MEFPAHLQDTIQRVLAGQATPEETRQVYDWFYSQSNEAEISAIVPEWKGLLEQRMKDQIDGNIDLQPGLVTRMQPRRRYRILAAAMVLLALGTGAYIWMQEKQQPTATAAAQLSVQDILPGSTKATLILDDGSRIALDSAATGKLAVQGASNIIQHAGQLSYNHTDAAGAAKPVINTLVVPKGGQYRLQLPDGTKVWLNAASSLRYPATFTGDTREVELTGEAFFDVAKNARQPFFVKTARQRVEVLGTQFNINAYADEPVLQTTLLEGSVRVAAHPLSGNLSKPVMLQPGQQSVLPASGIMTVHAASADEMEEATAWKDGRFRFTGIPLTAMMRQIARWYNIDVTYEGQIPDEKVRVSYARSITLDEALKILQLMQIHYRITNERQLVIMP